MPPITQDNIEINKPYSTNHRTRDCFEKSKDIFWAGFSAYSFDDNNSSGIVSKFELSVDTSSRMVGIQNNIKRKLFLNITDNDSENILKIISLKKNIDLLLKNDLVDKALIKLHKVLDNILLDDNKCSYLFRQFESTKLNDEIAVGLLCATIEFKSNNSRINFLELLRSDLHSKYSKEEVSEILVGL